MDYKILGSSRQGRIGMVAIDVGNNEAKCYIGNGGVGIDQLVDENIIAGTGMPVGAKVASSVFPHLISRGFTFIN